MGKAERKLLLVSVLFLGLSFPFPLWKLDIWAPQYPEGLSMSIWLSKITGNLDQINTLNHYIGMKHITPSAIPELAFMGPIVAGILATGLLAAWINRRFAIAAWMAGFLGLALAGLYDFYRWGYDYGHDLSPDAPIQIPGMTYQPPLLGHKTLLNIDAYSYPDLGGLAVGAALLLGFAALFWPWLRRTRLVAAALAILALFTACTAGPVPIEAGSDHCDRCRMTISDPRFGGEVITIKGRVHKFDSVSCLIHYYSANRSEVKAILVSDFLAPGKLIEATHARYVRSERLNGPMGSRIAAAGEGTAVQSLQKETQGEVLEWDSLLRSLSG